MYSVTLISVLAFVAQALGKHNTDVQDRLVDMLVDKLVNLVVQSSLLHQTDLDNIMLGKFDNFVTPGLRRGPLSISCFPFPSRTAVATGRGGFGRGGYGCKGGHGGHTDRLRSATTQAFQARRSALEKLACRPMSAVPFESFSHQSITRAVKSLTNPVSTCRACALDESTVVLPHDKAVAATGPIGDNLQFDHVQFYVNSLESLETYKSLEKRLNTFAKKLGTEDVRSRLHEGSELWSSLAAPGEELKEWTPFGRDLVRQLLVGAGFRITGHFTGSATRAYEVSSVESKGVRFIITAKSNPDQNGDEKDDCFSSQHVDRFLDAHAGQEGCGVLAFSAPRNSGTIDKIAESYQTHHPKLVVNHAPTLSEMGDHRIFEVFAYYKENGEADKGTILRFIERTSDNVTVLPGMIPVHGEYAIDAQDCRAFADHWVSNVHDRKGFLKTLEDTLGFTPKVDFNAGVVAAGEAIIESTVTGNAAAKFTGEHVKEKALTNQDQVFLPINNALSPVGHVHQYLEQLGQGVQHIATRVPDLIKFIQRSNNQREMLGEGFSFLRIPRSYYGRLQPVDLEKAAGLSSSDAHQVFHDVQHAGLVDVHGIVDLNISNVALDVALSKTIGNSGVRARAAAAVKFARYGNLYNLLRDQLSEDMYLSIVRNQILIDIQGDDVLLQIFTAPVLQKNAGQEAPFLEWIQRICSAKEIRAGCGGFGIRNFLTLFLSIEVSKAMDEQDTALAKGDEEGAAFAQKAISIFESQLNASNPVLTMIADGMTMEGNAREIMTAVTQGSDDYMEAQEAASKGAKMREEGNAMLQSISDDHKNRMAMLRYSRACALPQRQTQKSDS